jgi:PPOX class probable F420-dependent enzyme
MESKSPILDALDHTKTIALTTHRRDGRSVTTPVNVVIDDGHVYFRTWNTSGKAKRLRHDAHVEFAPATYTGRKLTGPELQARVRVLDEAQSRRARRVLRRAFPFLHGVLVPVSHKIKQVKTVHYELEPDPG